MFKISVIVPIYNSEKKKKKCLKSIINQTYKNLEIICINDGSTDNSDKILTDFAKKDDRIKIITQKNKGLSAARNAGIDFAQGEYISFVDSDDWISLTLYNDFIKILNKLNTKVDIYNFNVTSIKEYPDELFPETFFNIKNINNHNSLYTIHTFKDYKKPFNGNFGAYNKIYNLEFIKKNSIRFPVGLIFEDHPFYIESFIKASSIIINPRMYYIYFRRRRNNIMNNLEYKTFDIFKILDIARELIKSSEYFNYLKYAYLQHEYNTLSYMLFETASERQNEYYKQAQSHLKITSKFNLDKKIIKQLANYPIYKDILKLKCRDFVKKYKCKVTKSHWHQHSILIVIVS